MTSFRKHRILEEIPMRVKWDASIQSLTETLLEKANKIKTFCLMAC
jgi:hypothetical protein